MVSRAGSSPDPEDVHGPQMAGVPSAIRMAVPPAGRRPAVGQVRPRPGHVRRRASRRAAVPAGRRGSRLRPHRGSSSSTTPSRRRGEHAAARMSRLDARHLRRPPAPSGLGGEMMTISDRSVPVDAAVRGGNARTRGAIVRRGCDRYRSPGPEVPGTAPQPGGGAAGGEPRLPVPMLCHLRAADPDMPAGRRRTTGRAILASTPSRRFGCCSCTGRRSAACRTTSPG